ncbi:hypothetical protein JCM3774_006657 [Rhodotorula dairenensis]
MYAFWQPCFSELHKLVTDGLTEVHLVGALPLLGVNKHLRELVVKRLVGTYTNAAQLAKHKKRQLVPFAGHGEFVVEKGPHKSDDPRSTLGDLARKYNDWLEGPPTNFVL